MIIPQRKVKRRGATRLGVPKTKPAEPIRQKKARTSSSEKKIREGRNNIGQSLRFHRLAMGNCLTRLKDTPVASLLTLLVIAIALALPAALQVGINNAKVVGGNLGDSAQISLFLKLNTPERHAQRIANRLAEREAIKSVDYISPDQALAEFQELSGFNLGLATLDDNPMPAVLVINPKTDNRSSSEIEALLEELRAMPEVEMAQLDLEWVQRLYALLDLVTNAATFTSLFLIIAVVLIIGNTIRLMSQSYREEIQVSKLVGATDAYVRRPFLYTGALLGLGGSLLACAIVFAATVWLEAPIKQLTQLYQSDFKLLTLELKDILSLSVTGLILGVIGAWLAVSRFLRSTPS